MAKQSKFVCGFYEGSKGMKDLLGGRGSGLAEMSNLGLPVPPGFTITIGPAGSIWRTGSCPTAL
jgi:pyruvate, orthophosphate dikinase